MLEKVAQKFADKRLVVLTINGDRDQRKMKSVLDMVNTSLPVLRDRRSDVFASYRAYAIPTVYLIDRQGKIYSVWTGTVPDLERQLAESVEFVAHSSSGPTVARIGVSETEEPAVQFP